MARNGILIIEDDADIRMNLSESLVAEGYPTWEAENGEVALEILRGLSPESFPGCIILDLQMPVMSGEVFFSCLKESYPDTFAKIPVIVATAKGSIGSSALTEGEFERLKKPMELDDLFQMVEKYCAKATTTSA